AVLRVATPDGANGSTAPALTALRPELAADVRDELNVKRIEVVPDLAEVVERVVRPRPDLLGPRLGRDFPRGLAALRRGECSLHGDGSVEAGGQRLAPDEVHVSLTPRPGYAAAEAEGVTVALETALTADLLAEGRAREVIHRIQTMRKDAGFQVED